jgi:hypothetical protein
MTVKMQRIRRRRQCVLEEAGSNSVGLGVQLCDRVCRTRVRQRSSWVQAIDGSLLGHL